MSRNDVSGVAGPANDIVVLYTAADNLPIPDGATPAPRIDLLKPADALAAACWLALFFRTDAKRLCVHGRTRRYAVRFFPDHAAIVVDLDLLRAPSCTVSSLISFAPQINQWLRIWSESAAHIPDYEPTWAKAMGLDEASMCVIITGIAYSIAQPNAFEITIHDSELHSCTFQVPPRATLRERTHTRSRARQLVEVRKVEDLPTARTPGGAKVLLVGDVKGRQMSGTITLQPAALHRNKVRVPQKVRVRRQTRQESKGKDRK